MTDFDFLYPETCTYTFRQWPTSFERLRAAHDERMSRSSELDALRAKAEKARARARHASNKQWKSDAKARASRNKEMEESFHEIKRKRPSLSDRSAAAVTGAKFEVSYSTVLRAVGLKRKSSSKNDPDAIG